MQPPDDSTQQLLAAARAAADQAYCPYSQFAVGAAIKAEDGSIYTGCNVENASFGLSSCAERNAIFQMVAAGQRKLIAVALYTPTTQPTPPCGACRQVLSEFCQDAEIHAECQTGIAQWSLRELLPELFSNRNIR